MKLYILLLLRIFWMHTVAPKSRTTPPPMKPKFSCQTDVPAQPLMLKNLAGVWYEIGRVPNKKVMQCLNITVPDKADGELVLDLAYISTYDGSHTPIKESVSFPWNERTQNSTFDLYYGRSSRFPSVTYKIVLNVDSRVILLCGYSSVSPVPLFKLLSRQRELDQKTADYIKSRVEDGPLKNMIIWTEQSKCSASDRRVAGPISGLALYVWLIVINATL